MSRGAFWRIRRTFAASEKWLNGAEVPRIRVTLATGISRETCERINLGYRDPATIDVDEFINREDEGILYVERAGELLYRLEDEPEWARVG